MVYNAGRRRARAGLFHLQADLNGMVVDVLKDVTDSRRVICAEGVLPFLRHDAQMLKELPPLVKLFLGNVHVRLFTETVVVSCVSESYANGPAEESCD